MPGDRLLDHDGMAIVSGAGGGQEAQALADVGWLFRDLAAAGGRWPGADPEHLVRHGIDGDETRLLFHGASMGVAYLFRKRPTSCACRGR